MALVNKHQNAAFHRAAHLANRPLQHKHNRQQVHLPKGLNNKVRSLAEKAITHHRRVCQFLKPRKKANIKPPKTSFTNTLQVQQHPQINPQISALQQQGIIRQQGQAQQTSAQAEYTRPPQDEPLEAVQVTPPAQEPAGKAAKRYLADRLNHHQLSEASDAKEIRASVSKVRHELIDQGADFRYLTLLDGIELKITKETQQIHTESMLLKLIKKAGEDGASTSETLDIVRNSPGIRHQPQALAALDRISPAVIEQGDAKNIDVLGMQFYALPTSQSKSEFADMGRIRENAMMQAANSNRMDKENTGLSNTIIADESNNLIMLKNSVDYTDKNEDQTMVKSLIRKANENFDYDQGRIISTKRSYTHNKKNNHIKAIFGQGTFGKVRLGQDMLSGKHIAVKKMDSVDNARQEIAERQRLTQALGADSTDMNCFLTAGDIAISQGKNGAIKAYVTSELQEGDGLQSIDKLQDKKAEAGQKSFERAHGQFVLKTMENLEALNRNHMVHGDLKWANMIGGKVADIDGLCYQKGDPIKLATPPYLPPELKLVSTDDGKGAFIHPTKQSYNKHTSFTFGRMLLESIDPMAHQTFKLPVNNPNYPRPARGYSQKTPIPQDNSSGQPFTPYEKEVIRLAYQLADTKPENRPSIAEAKQTMTSINAYYNQPPS